MILVFGGTTEGRIVMSVCDDAHKPYFYSTKGDLQQYESIYANRLSGGMNQEDIATFCRRNNIKLIIDAAHPFAEELHQNISITSRLLNIPVIRYERKYEKQDLELLWFDTYDAAIDYLLENKINKLLALTGVNTIAKLKRYWQENDCIFRILDREDSRNTAKAAGYPLEKTLYYETDSDDLVLFQKLNPQAIITKESGHSGGFEKKVNAAKEAGIPLLVIKRPKLSREFISVYGEYGLRRTIEQLVPDFFDLKTGYTTGTCATVATKAALILLLTGEKSLETGITLPNGEYAVFPVEKLSRDERTATASVKKYSGDDPDVTNGLDIISCVKLNTSHKGVRFLQGKGVGVVTLPGLDIPLGEPAINKTPRMMMKREVFKTLRHYADYLPETGLHTGVDITISVRGGEEIASKTFNPKLGIVGGISIIGTSGIVKPFSSEAFVNAIKREMQVAKALGCKKIIINSGAKSERYIKQEYPNYPAQAFVHFGNFIGESIQAAAELEYESLVLGIMIGKAVKLAEGALDTHSKKTAMNKDFLKKLATEAGCDESIVEAIDQITLARQLWALIPTSEFYNQLIEKCYNVCKPLFLQGELEVFLIREDGKIIRQNE